MSAKINIAGQKINSLTVICESGLTKEKRVVWECLCDCGNITHVEGKRLRNGHTKTCGKCPRNKYFEKDGYMVGLTFKGDEFYFDKEDLGLINQYIVYISIGGYVIASKGNISRRLHRLLMNPKASLEVDHVNGNKRDNRRCNIRLCNRQQNIMNSGKRKKCSSKYKGVSWHNSSKKWHASIAKNGKQYYLGLFKEEKNAAMAYNQRAKELFGEFARLNDL